MLKSKSKQRKRHFNADLLNLKAIRIDSIQTLPIMSQPTLKSLHQNPWSTPASPTTFKRHETKQLDTEPKLADKLTKYDKP